MDWLVASDQKLALPSGASHYIRDTGKEGSGKGLWEKGKEGAH